MKDGVMIVETKDKILKELKDRTDNILDDKKKKVIKSIINQIDWYKAVSLDTFLSILDDLGYDTNEATGRELNIKFTMFDTTDPFNIKEECTCTFRKCLDHKVPRDQKRQGYPDAEESRQRAYYECLCVEYVCNIPL